MSTTSVARLVIDALRASNTERLFCIPGVQNDDFFNALVDAPDIAPIVCRHEQGAAYMAMGAAQVTGRPAAFCVVPGPGMLNASAALTSAYWAYARVLGIIGQIPSSLMGRNFGTLHDLPDQNAILGQLTKQASEVLDPTEAASTLQSAVDAVNSGLPRPVTVEVPVDVWATEATGTIRPPQASMPELDLRQVERAAELARSARRPLIVVGSGAYEAASEVIALAENMQAAVTTRRQGHGVVPTAHPLFVPITVAHELWPDVDLVIGIGSRIEWPLGGWGHDSDLALVQINVDASEVDRHGITNVGICADAAVAVAALNDALGPLDRPDRSTELDEQRAWFEEATAHLVPQREYTAALREVVPDEGVLVEDVTQIGFASHLFYDHRRPRTFLTSGAAGTLGAGTAVAIGASAAAGATPVVGIIGDGGFLFTATELATAVQHAIPANIVLFNNNAYGNVRRIQRTRFGEDRTIASALDNPNFEQLVGSFGAAYWRTDSPSGMAQALSECIAVDAPGVVEVTVEAMPDPWPFLRMPRNRGLGASA